MRQARSWKLVFSCPACNRPGGVAAEKMAAVMRCPHCHVNVVIENRGLRIATKADRRAVPSAEVFDSLDATDFGVGGYRGIGYSLALTLLLLVFAVVGTAFMSSRNMRGVTDDGAALRSAATSFQSAWLQGDVDSARSYVIQRDRALYDSWSIPRRAALAASFGNDFRGHVAGVEIVQFKPDTAIVRVGFVIRGREQQVFQNWHGVAGDWRLSLRQSLQVEPD